MTRALRARVAIRAGRRYEYCRLHEEDLPGSPFHLEHIGARKHGGLTSPGNPACRPRMASRSQIYCGSCGKEDLTVIFRQDVSHRLNV